jgi:FkbH-like protein
VAVDSSLKIAVLGNFTTEYLAKAVQEECRRNSIEAGIYNSEYGRYNQVILNPVSSLYSFDPALAILFLEGKMLFPKWYETPTLTASANHKMKLVNEVYLSLVNLVENLHKHCSAKIILNNFKIPYHSPLGILDSKMNPGLKRMICMLNGKLEDYAMNKSYLYIFDYNGLCSHMGNSVSEDSKMYYMAKNVLSLHAAKTLAHEYMRYILPMVSRNRKCLVLDLDNTLWGGAAGEDGISGILLDVSGPGKSYYDFQQEVLNLYHKGILLAVNSKNNYEDAVAIIDNHPYMLLKKKHFSALKINWRDKAENLREIARELNIGTDSLVFFDDNPVERASVKSSLPEVMTVDVPVDSSKYAAALREICDFEYLNLTEEDRKRNEMYAANIKRLESQKQAQSVDDFLAGLETTAVVACANEFTLPRIAQLTQKTNQFNMTTKRYSNDDISRMLESDRHMVFSCSVSDSFGDSGLVGVCIAELDAERSEAFIDSFLLSCRVLGRDVEYAFLSAVISVLTDMGVKRIRSAFIKTSKNQPARDFYLNAGFTPESVESDKTIYIFKTGDKLKEARHINVQTE